METFPQRTSPKLWRAVPLKPKIMYCLPWLTGHTRSCVTTTLPLFAHRIGYSRCDNANEFGSRRTILRVTPMAMETVTRLMTDHRQEGVLKTSASSTLLCGGVIRGMNRNCDD